MRAGWRKRIAGLAAALTLLATLPAAAPMPRWNAQAVERLLVWLESAPQDGLASFDAQARAVRVAQAAGDGPALDEAASRAATQLLDAHRQGCCHAAQKAEWGMAVPPRLPAELAISRAVAMGEIDGLYAEERPAHPWYLALRAALADERDPARRARLLLNMDRWRWMPRDPGSRYLLVNTAAFEATLWENGREAGRWRVIVGKPSTPTPIFSATISGVIFNPWWEIPASIVAESVGALVRNRPAEAARRGYVVEGGRYRQRPGDSNALGRMKLVMPNSHAVYLHDTPSRGLFARETRAFSHGCVRVGDALGLASALLASGGGGWSRGQTDRVVASGETQMVPLREPMPVYIAYFTAQPAEDGTVSHLTDLYGRDRADGRTHDASPVCPV